MAGMCRGEDLVAKQEQPEAEQGYTRRDEKHELRNVCHVHVEIPKRVPAAWLRRGR